MEKIVSWYAIEIIVVSSTGTALVTTLVQSSWLPSAIGLPRFDHGSRQRGGLRHVAVPHPLQERPRAPPHGHTQGRRRHGRRHRRHLQGRCYRRRHWPRRASPHSQRRPRYIHEASRPRLLPRRRLCRELGLLHAVLPLPERARISGPRRGRVRRLPPRA